ncbi:MAG: hypothetical protein JO085_11265 [Acidimicrobiia bacterium]|nr:hypothetical protein [Acidimicrobiia bacterium]
MDEHQPGPFDDIAAMGTPATPDALRQIVARHQRKRTRVLGIALAVALVAGPVAGWAIGQSGGGGQQVATGSAPAGSNADIPTAAGAPASAAISGVGSTDAFAGPTTNGPKATHLFTRTTSDGITIRAYRVDPPTPPTPPTPPANAPTTTTSSPSIKTPPAGCPMPMLKQGAVGVTSGGSGGSGAASGAVSSGPATGFGSGQSSSSSAGEVAPAGPPVTATNGGAPQPQPPTPTPCPPLPPPCKATPAALAELSTDAAVGQSFDPIDEKQPSDALSHLAIGAFGGAEGSPAMFATVQTGPGVATVRLRLTGNVVDQMAPSGNVAVLAHAGMPSSPNDVVIEALDASGNVMATMPVTKPGPGPAFACASGGMVGTARTYHAPGIPTQPATQPATSPATGTPQTTPTTR